MQELFWRDFKNIFLMQILLKKKTKIKPAGGSYGKSKDGQIICMWLIKADKILDALILIF